MAFWRRFQNSTARNPGDGQHRTPSARDKQDPRSTRNSQLEWEIGAEDHWATDVTAVESQPRGAFVRSEHTFQRHWPGRAVRPAHGTVEPSTLVAKSPAGTNDQASASDGDWHSVSNTGYAPPKTKQGLISAFLGAEAAPRVQAVRQSLELALDDWWSQNVFLSPGLLRNGLLVLEAGHKLEEAYLSLLLRSALRLQRGMLTALRHQTDPDRAAYLLKEALLYEAAPLSPATLWQLQQEDENSAEWAPLLLYDLQTDVQELSGPKQRLAFAAMRQLQSDKLLVEAPAPPPQKTTALPLYTWPVGRVVTALFFLLILSALLMWGTHRARAVDGALVPAGRYTLGNVMHEIPARTAVVNHAFTIDRTEVTNRSYRLCYEQGGCPLPSQTDSATHEKYFFEPAFDRHPVVSVDWYAAGAYCAWAGKRLPSATEWEVAASVAPATQRRYMYPWGDGFQRQFANSALNGIGDTQPVGTYRGVGTSSFGAEDMAGNVAEWTATPADPQAYENPATPAAQNALFVVKGGSYADRPDALRTDAGLGLRADTTETWLGFRCVQDIARK